MGGDGEIIVSVGWWRKNFGWLCMVVGDGGEIMVSRGWLWEVAKELRLVVGVRRCSCMVVGGCGWSHDLVMPIAGIENDESRQVDVAHLDRNQHES